eukprot:456743_1
MYSLFVIGLLLIVMVQSQINDPFEQSHRGQQPIPMQQRALTTSIQNVNNSDVSVQMRGVGERDISLAINVNNAQVVAQPGYCVAKDCWNCLRLETMIGAAGLCKSSCPACAYCIMTESCTEGLELGAVMCGIDCGFGAVALSSFYMVKAKCPTGYVWLKEHCPNPFYEKKD